MDLIVEMRFGSHLYGTATPESDLDLKGVFVPEARDILLQRAPAAVSLGPAKRAGERNRPGDVDRDYFSLHRYFTLLAGGQTLALEMLFAPDPVLTRPATPLWREIQAAAPCLVSRRAAAFVRYCRQQANTYGLKGARMAAARQTLAMLEAAETRLGASARLEQIATEVERLAAASDHAALVDMPMPGGRMIRHFDICGRKLPYSLALKTARETVARLMDEYGQRARAAEQQQGTDWKALAHAVRVGREAIELFTTGRLAFPLACADHLRRIRRGELPYEAVAAEIEGLVPAVEAAAAASTLPEAPDHAVMETLVERVYRQKVLHG